MFEPWKIWLVKFDLGRTVVMRPGDMNCEAQNARYDRAYLRMILCRELAPTVAGPLCLIFYARLQLCDACFL
jgi:hypothetical protein